MSQRSSVRCGGSPKPGAGARSRAGSWKREADYSYNDGFARGDGHSDMLFDLRHTHGDRAHVQRTFEVAAFEPREPEYRVATPVRLAMEVERSGTDVYRVSGRIHARLELECGRCLDP